MHMLTEETKNYLDGLIASTKVTNQKEMGKVMSLVNFESIKGPDATLIYYYIQGKLKNEREH